jgi:hypothetical protein
VSLKRRQDSKLAFVKRAGFVDEIGRYRCPSRDSSATPVRPQKRGEAIADSVNNLATAKVTRGKATLLSNVASVICRTFLSFFRCRVKSKDARIRRGKYWEIIVNNIIKAGFSMGWVSALDDNGHTIWIVDAHRDGKRFVMRADEKLTAFN